MKIISKYKDYYDGAQALGIDETCIYFRKEKLTVQDKWSNFDAVINELIPWPRRLDFYSRNCDKDGKSIHFGRFLIGFCGKLYPAYKFVFVEKSRFEVKTFYSARKAQEFYESFKKEYSGINPEYRYRTEIDRLDLRDEFDKEGFSNHKVVDWFHELGVPSFVYPLDAYSEQYYSGSKNDFTDFERKYVGESKVKLLLNPCMKYLGFYRAMDTYTCFQEIHQFLSGVLGQQKDPGIPMTDLDKVRQHGFDEKYGFRKRPGGKKKRK